MDQLHKKLQRDPDDLRTRRAYLNRVREAYGASTFDVITALERWKGAEPELKSGAAAQLATLLGKEYALEAIQRFECGGGSLDIAVYRHLRSGARMNLVPGGRTRYDADYIGESAVSKPLLVASAPCTQEQWDAVAARARTPIPDARTWREPTLPMEGVLRADVRRWLRLAGGALRLPLRREWTWACRGGTATRFPWGADDDPSYRWFSDNAGGRPHSPAEHEGKTNALGLVDMLGNVEELVEDDYGSRSKVQFTAGGSYAGLGYLEDAEAFNSLFTDQARAWVGFRAVRDLPMLDIPWSNRV